jgi:hypothetical protein
MEQGRHQAGFISRYPVKSTQVGGEQSELKKSSLEPRNLLGFFEVVFRGLRNIRCHFDPFR